MSPFRKRSAGFSYIEVLIALLIFVIAITAVASALITSLSAEELIDYSVQAELKAQSIRTQILMGEELDEIMKRESGSWVIQARRTDSPRNSDAPDWTTVSVAPAERPSLQASFSLVEL